MASRKSMRPYKSSAGGWGVLRAGLALTEQGIAMSAVRLGRSFLMGYGRHGSVLGSAVAAGTGPLDSPIFDACHGAGVSVSRAGSNSSP